VSANIFPTRLNVDVKAEFFLFLVNVFRRSFIEKVFKEADKFFTSPIEDKQRYERKPGRNFGYLGKGVETLVTYVFARMLMFCCSLLVFFSTNYSMPDH